MRTSHVLRAFAFLSTAGIAQGGGQMPHKFCRRLVDDGGNDLTAREFSSPVSGELDERDVFRAVINPDLVWGFRKNDPGSTFHDRRFRGTGRRLLVTHRVVESVPGSVNDVDDQPVFKAVERAGRFDDCPSVIACPLLGTTEQAND